VPILTPPISSGGGSGDDDVENSKQYVLVPNSQRIVVRSAHHGKRVCVLNPGADGDNVTIRAVVLAWLPTRRENEDNNDEEDDEEVEKDDDSESDEEDTGEWVILAACNNGIVHEWSITDLSTATMESNKESLSSRRSFQLTCTTMQDLDLIHLTSPAALTEEAAILYGLVKGTSTDNESNDEKSAASSCLVRFEIPQFAPRQNENGESENKVSLDLAVKPLVSVKKNVSSKVYQEESSENNHVCLRRKDSIFGLMAAYRPSSLKADDNDLDYEMDDNDNDSGAKGDVFVVMCASHGLIIYRDSLPLNNDDDTPSDPSTKMVHFAKSIMKSSQYHYTKEQQAFSSMAISPNTKDLALGRANGHIEVFDNIFENVSIYLNGTTKLEEHHPEEVTVRRTVHWHAHPVRALAFLTAAYGRSKGSGNNNSSSFANPMSLLSGGEESVLVTWQLDRNFHKPSNFIARVSQGSIVHTLTCQYSGKIIVLCSDNSIQCYNGSNYEREWAEQGLASMALHGEEDNEQGPNGGPIVMVKDPITNYPMLTNLPGAPGMVHWYDPKSASVVGTLEVAPYNRVSRRDPTSDPHIPAPAVTHMAVGQNGKDMVTVDTVWTENTSVGSAYNLAGPQGGGITTPMNVCTSIKFWSYVGDSSSKGSGKVERRRRNGDVPMNYELVSSMAAPHGREGEICALAVSPDGSVACTLSQEEDAFRVWVKNTTATTDTGGALWKCLYKVKTPSGYANLLSQRVDTSLGQQLINFSSDGTVLSVSYGPHVTLWDHSNATLLTSVTLGDEKETLSASEDIQTVNFLTKNDDVMLVTTASQIGLKSPFGGVNSSCYLGEDEWSFDTGSFGKEALVSAVVPLYDFKGKGGATGGGFFAVSITLDNGSKSTISIISRDEGSVVCAEGTDTPIQWQVDGEVQSLCLDKCNDSFVQLLAVTNDCQMLSLSYGSDGRTKNKGRGAVGSSSARRGQAPVLKTGAENAEVKPSAKRRKVSIGISQGSENARSVSGFEFPALSGKFTSAFIAQSLGKR